MKGTFEATDYETCDRMVYKEQLLHMFKWSQEFQEGRRYKIKATCKQIMRPPFLSNSVNTTPKQAIGP